MWKFRTYWMWHLYLHKFWYSTQSDDSACMSEITCSRCRSKEHNCWKCPHYLQKVKKAQGKKRNLTWKPCVWLILYFPHVVSTVLLEQNHFLLLVTPRIHSLLGQLLKIFSQHFFMCWPQFMELMHPRSRISLKIVLHVPPIIYCL